MAPPDPLVAGWLRYAREVVSDQDHRRACAARGGSDPDAVLLERETGRPASFAEDVRWPGYVGRDYRRGDVLWISNIHRNFDSGGLTASFADASNDCIRQWRDGRTDDESFLSEIRAVYELGLRRWTVGSWSGRALLALDVPIEAVAYTNVAKCQAVGTGTRLQRFCIQRWSLRSIVQLLEPGLVLLTSATGLARSGPESWPCDVVGFSQRNGRLLVGSPWKPPGTTGAVAFECWMSALRAERQ